MELNKTSSSKYSLLNKFPLFASPIPELPSYASYDNILNYCLNDTNSIYTKFNFPHQDEQYDQRCANYDNLSYLIIDGISSKKISNKGIGKIASCKDYFAATTGFIYKENGQRE